MNANVETHTVKRADKTNLLKRTVWMMNDLDLMIATTPPSKALVILRAMRRDIERAATAINDLPIEI